MIIVLVISVAGFLAYQHWQTNDAAVHGDARITALADADAGAKTTDRDASSLHVIEDRQASNGVQSFFAKLFSDDDDATPPVTEQAYAVQQYSAAEHTEWVGTFYTELYSPGQPNEVAPPAEEVVPVISGRVLTQHGMPVEGIEVTASFRDYFKTTDSIARKKAAGTQTTTTNENGFYAFRGMPDGIYLVDQIRLLQPD